ncbi:transporter [Bacillus sp. AFS041924]|uniref:sodium:solute symporter family transporter n=1 Tax=Bacillus sp. AFS041924 TaxID=2033503 RepID=UPI000BFD1BB5|nr:transporter [Bacillus sp. AFS041924]PGS54138.1 transporter [Bacillus sp. AFS041924]
MNSRSFREYVQGPIQIGMGMGIISLLARWVTGTTILSSPESMIKYGVFGGIGYAFLGAIALFVFSFIGKKVRKEYHDCLTIGDYLKRKLNPLGFWIMICILILTSLHILYIQSMSASTLFHFLFNLPLYIEIFIFISFCVLFAGFGGLKMIHGLAGFQVITMFAAAILIPLYFFVKEGVQPVYDGIRLFHPYMLVIDHYDLWGFLFSGLLVGFGQFFFDITSWHRLFMIEVKKVPLTFSLSGLIWGIFPLSFSCLFIIVIFTGGFTDIQSILVGLANKITTPFFFILFVLCVFNAITSTFGAVLHSLASLIVNNIIEPLQKKSKSDHQKIRIAYLLSVIIGAIIFFSTIIQSQNIIELLFYSGNVYSALLFPVLVIVFSKGKVANYIPISIIISILLSYVVQPYVGDFQSIWLSSLFSIIIIIICFAISLFTQKRDLTIS